MDPLDEHLYEIATGEVATRQLRPGVWGKAFADCDGDTTQAIARYIRLRVEQLRQDLRDTEARAAQDRKESEWTEGERAAARRIEELRRSTADLPDEVIRELKVKGGTEAIRFAEKRDGSWMCSCAQLNSYTAERCKKCAYHRDYVLRNCTIEAIIGPEFSP